MIVIVLVVDSLIYRSREPSTLFYDCHKVSGFENCKGNDTYRTKVAASGIGKSKNDDGDEDSRRPPGFRKWREWFRFRFFRDERTTEQLYRLHPLAKQKLFVDKNVALA